MILYKLSETVQSSGYNQRETSVHWLVRSLFFFLQLYIWACFRVYPPPPSPFYDGMYFRTFFIKHPEANQISQFVSQDSLIGLEFDVSATLNTAHLGVIALLVCC